MSDFAPSAGKFLYMDNGTCPPAGTPAVSAQAEETITEEEALRLLFDALPEVDMDPMVQLSGYLSSDDPSYLPDHRGVRTAVVKVGREKLIRHLLRLYCDRPADKSL